MTRALCVIDVQNEYFAGGKLPLWAADEVEARIVGTIERARKAGDKIILVRHQGGTSGAFAEGSTGAEIRPAILTAAGDAPVVTKRFADSFQETDLMRHLSGVSELLISGFMTQNCVVFTAMSRAADAFKIRVIGDLCSAPSEMVHAIALNALRSKLTVIGAAEAWS